MRSYTFKKALPVWIGDPECINNTEGFFADCDFSLGDEITISLTASTHYRLFVNGRFVHSGPVRCANGFFRVDELVLSSYMREGRNRIAVEVSCYYVNSFAYPRQRGFLQAELLSHGEVIAATADGSHPFYGMILDHRVREVPRYSYQRTFTEVYRLTPRTNDWQWNTDIPGEAPTRTTGGVTMERGLPRHTFPAGYIDWYGGGYATPCEKETLLDKERFIDNRDNQHLFIFKPEEQVCRLHREACGFEFKKSESAPTGKCITVATSHYADGAFSRIHVGYFAATFTASAPTDVYLLFAEMPDENGEIDPLRTLQVIDAVKLSLTEAGRYDFRTAEPYGCMLVRLVTTGADLTVEDFRIEEYAYPAPIGDPVKPKTEKQAAIYEAARRSFAHNAPDIFIDCPTRERAGWLCDSFFEGRVEWALNPELPVERNFLENFALPEFFECVPDGMIAMCYPSDHHKGGRHIPQWAMWFFLQVADYRKRGGNAELSESLRDRFHALAAYFARYENELGLVEDLPSWNFVEWSMANNLTGGVNYPTNMMYSAFLAAGAELYGIDELRTKAERIKDTVCRLSFDGTYFRDHDIRDEKGTLVPCPERTETCQYYAFFFDIATPSEYPALWEKLVTLFGPKRDAATTEPDIYISNSFVGNYMRLDILRRYGMREEMLSEIEDYFYGMAEKTGTLWEHSDNSNSCDHGFASYVIYLMRED